MFEKQRKLFVDIDGTLAVWQVGTPYEELLKRGYFRNLPAHESVVQAVRMLIAEEKELGFETYALSALMPGNPWAEEDKRVWLAEHLPELAASRMIFCEPGAKKAEIVSEKFGRIHRGFVLLDDYSENLHAWEQAGGKGIKLRNGINGTKGTWNGHIASRFASPEHTEIQILRTLGLWLVKSGAL